MVKDCLKIFIVTYKKEIIILVEIKTEYFINVLKILTNKTTLFIFITIKDDVHLASLHAKV